MLSDLLEAKGLRDAELAGAYEAAGEVGRGRLKALLAALLALHPPRRLREARRMEVHDLGLAARQLHRPRPFALALLDAGFASPAKLLAALVPALASGVGQVAVVGLGTASLPAGLLPALELAGVETVARLSPAAARAVLDQVARAMPAGMLLCFGPRAVALAASCSLLRWDAVPGWQPARLGLLADGSFDADAVVGALEFLHPGCHVVHGQAGRSRKGMADFLSQGFDAVVAPDALVPLAHEHCTLAWGPSQAGFWFWPELCPELFLARSLALEAAP